MAVHSAIDINKAVMKVSKAEDVRQQTRLMMQPYANWEEYLMPGPISIAILGELVFISSNGDFSINQNPPKGGFKHIKYPGSFRASLMQVSNSGWRAFNSAHTKMDQIRLHSLTVPDYIKTVVQILFQDDERLIVALLPSKLSNIKDVADECTQLAESVKDEFMSVINLIQELLEACFNSKSVYEKDLQEVQRKLEESKLREGSAKKAKELADKYNARLEKQLDEAHKQFNDAMSSIPSGWEMIGMSFVESLTKIFGTAASSSMNSATKSDSSGGQQSNLSAANNILSKSGQLQSLASALSALVSKGQIDINKVYDERKHEVKSDWAKNQFSTIKNSIMKEEECSVKTEALPICNLGIDICEQLGNISQLKAANPETITLLINEITKLAKKAEQFDIFSKQATNSPALTPTPPNMAKSMNNSEEQTQEGAANIAMRNARYKTELSKAQLETSQAMYDKSFENLKKVNDELTEILVTMRSCEVKEIDFETTIKMLAKGLDALGRVKEQWEKMVQFFQMISNLINTCFSKNLKCFVSDAENIQTISGYSTNYFVRDMIYTQAFNASNVSNLVHMIASAYTEVSGKYLMDKVSKLGTIMALDPSNPNFESERQQLAAGCDEAQKKINELVKQKKKEFENDLQTRVNKIDSELASVLPPPSAKEQKAIKENVKQAMKQLTYDEENNYL